MSCAAGWNIVFKPGCEVEQQVVGHIIAAKRWSKEEITLPVLNFGPLSVLPEYQRKGVGKALINGMLEKAKAEGHGAILFSAGRSIIRSLDLRKLLCMGFRIVRDIIFPLLWQWS
ncbi:MAG: GNAT family N-acetyltransferase [Eisenbergiella massiliensis]